ncbi:MAG: tRNA lysidine(34) synthetase TilS [Deltaproteobacteria bacterium]|nr:tRNA lysidine(34) synthetase TilS [Deltaproteobacteria bacterium]
MAGVVRTLRARVAAALVLVRGPIAVACSGGPDSMALADAAVAVCGAARVVIVHVDHGLRPDAAATAAMVATWAASVGAACEIATVEVARTASLEAAARRARYAALRAIADRLGAAAILTGHTARDQAETVMLRLIRGTGPAGLVGIRRRRGRLVRPLLDAPRAEIVAYVQARGLPVHDDPMNADRRFARTRVRDAILPLLATENPAIERALGQLADAATAWRAAIDRAARKADRRAAVGPTTWDVTALARLDDAVLARAIDRIARRAGLAIEAPHVRAITRLARAPRAGSRAIDVPGGAVSRVYDRLEFGPRPAESRAELQVAGPDGPYEVRAWRPGDRMRPARLRGRSRTVADLWIDAQIPRAARLGARVVVRAADGAIVWAEHLGAAHGAEIAVTPVPPRTSG